MVKLSSTIMVAVSLSVASPIWSQTNLVPNPSFEDFSPCPTDGSQLGNAAPWHSPSAPWTPDLFHACGANIHCRAPINSWGTQQSRTGEAHAGIYGMQWPNGFQLVIREYMRVVLDAPLVAGVHYCVGFYASLSEQSSHSINSIGIYFSATNNAPVNGYVMPVTPQVQNPTSNFLSDKTNWMPVGGVYIASGGEQYMTIGSFSPNDAGAGMQQTPGTYSNIFSYYYIDDVSVIRSDELTGSCMSGPSTDLQEQASKDVRLSPNPMSTSSTLTLGDLTGGHILEVFDSFGVLVRHMKVTGNRCVLERGDLCSGVYLLRVSDQQGQPIYHTRFVID